mmetsp:Transcript_11866/g.30010  ORF Transcript_11866/g.30010 Transcript_11866/m.30010 type:complete len:106 (-) Transcript_11866:82-399(-)
MKTWRKACSHGTQRGPLSHLPPLCCRQDLVGKFIPEAIGKDIEKACAGIYPLQNVFIRKVKVMKSPKFDLMKLMEVHGDYTDDVPAKVERPAEPIPGSEPVEAEA